jgi:hypothetical protein
MGAAGNARPSAWEPARRLRLSHRRLERRSPWGITAEAGEPYLGHARDSLARLPRRSALAEGSLRSRIRTRPRTSSSGRYFPFSGVSTAGQLLKTAGNPISTVAQLWRTLSHMRPVAPRSTARMLRAKASAPHAGVDPLGACGSARRRAESPQTRPNRRHAEAWSE